MEKGTNHLKRENINVLTRVRDILNRNLEEFLKDKTQLINNVERFRRKLGSHISVESRLSHTLTVSNVAVEIARRLYPIAKKDLSCSEEEFILLVECIALAHDIGHTPYGHRGEDALNLCAQEENLTPEDIVMREKLYGKEYEKRRVERLKQKKQEELIDKNQYSHNEFSVIVFLAMMKANNIDTEHEMCKIIAQGILAHSTTRYPGIPPHLAQQIVAIADKIVGAGKDVRDLNVTGIVPKTVTEEEAPSFYDDNNPYAEGEVDFAKMVREFIDELEVEYRKKGYITGWKSECRESRRADTVVKALESKRNNSVTYIGRYAEALEARRVLRNARGRVKDKKGKIIGGFETSYDMWNVREYTDGIVERNITEEDVLGNEEMSHEEAIRGVYYFLMRNPDIFRQLLEEKKKRVPYDYSEYPIPTQMKIFIAGMHEADLDLFYERHSPDFERQIDKQKKYQYIGEENVDVIADDIDIRMYQRGFEVLEQGRRIRQTDRYYDSKDQRLKKEERLLRTRKELEIDENGNAITEPKYKATYSKVHNPILRTSLSRDRSDVSLESEDFSVALTKMQEKRPKLKEVRFQKTPQIIIEKEIVNERRLYKVVEGRKSPIEVVTSQCYFVDPKTARRVGEYVQIELKPGKGYKDADGLIEECSDILAEMYGRDVMIADNPLYITGIRELEKERIRRSAEKEPSDG